MGIIGKDFKYKIIKNFLSKDELHLLSLYCEIRHRTNFTEFDFQQNNVGDTCLYGDPIMDSLMLKKQSLIEKEAGKKLLGNITNLFFFFSILVCFFELR